MSNPPMRGSRASGRGTQGSADPKRSETSPKEREAPRGEAAWRAARQRIADRNARARKVGKQQRQEHESRLAAYRREMKDPDGPPQAI
jgi:hypothetical protein